jgi:ssRNA-specific RNase YbeY (16S rRNA maturation enzyme)
MKKIVNPEIVEKTVREHGITTPYEVNVFMASEQEMRKVLDGKYHDVLSFPLDFDRSYPDGVVRLGDILVCDQEKDVEGLIEHGCLHLLGIHHE